MCLGLKFKGKGHGVIKCRLYTLSRVSDGAHQHFIHAATSDTTTVAWSRCMLHSWSYFKHLYVFFLFKLRIHVLH